MKPEINAICTIMIAIVATGIVAASLLSKFHELGRDRAARPVARPDASLARGIAAGRLALLERQGPLPHAAPGRCAVAQDAIVSEELAKKFAIEKETALSCAGSRGEGLDVIGAHYVPNLHTVELKPWARAAASGVLHQPRGLAHLERLLRLRDRRRAKSSSRSASSSRR